MFAVPLLGQFLLVYAINVKPLTLAVCVLAHHHLSKGRTSTVAISGLVRVVLPLASLEALPGRLLPSLFLAPVIVGTVETTLM